MRRICVVVTARPSYSRIRSALHAIAEHPELELQLIVAASALLDRYGNVAECIEQDGFSIHQRLHCLLEGERLVTAAKTTGLAIIELATAFERLQPDIVVTIADRYETLATAIAAAYTNIPVAHIQGGEITGSIDEKVRHAVTKLADIHLVATHEARARVIGLGERPEAVIVTGCPSIDLAGAAITKPLDPAIIKAHGTGAGVDLSKGYIIVLQHPVTTQHEQARQHIEETLYAVKDCGLPVLLFWPNPDAGSDGTSKGIRMFREQEQPQEFHMFRNLPPDDFIRLLFKATAIVGNSSVAIREGSFLGVPAVNVGDRQRNRECGANVITVPHARQAIATALSIHRTRPRVIGSSLYGDGRAAQRIADALATINLTIEKVLL